MFVNRKHGMTEQDIDQKFDEILMFIYTGNIRNGKNFFANTINSAVNDKLDQAIQILESNGGGSMIDQIRQLKDD